MSLEMGLLRGVQAAAHMPMCLKCVRVCVPEVRVCVRGGGAHLAVCLKCTFSSISPCTNKRRPRPAGMEAACVVTADNA